MNDPTVDPKEIMERIKAARAVGSGPNPQKDTVPILLTLPTESIMKKETDALKEIMDHYKSRVDLAAFVQFANDSLSWTIDDSGVRMAVGPSGGLPFHLHNNPLVKQAIAEIEGLRDAKVVNIMINDIPAGTVVPVHRDFLLPINGIKLPIVERWHLPVSTNDLAVWWDETMLPGTTEKMALGVWHGPVKYWKNHNVSNHGTTPRMHLVVDLDIPVPGEAYS